MLKIGITERGDAALHLDEWLPKLDKVDGVILISKNPATLLSNAARIPWEKCIVHCTITGWGGSPVEPGAPAPDESLAAYKSLCERLGGERVVLRIDPIIPTPAGLELANSVRTHSLGRVRLSFLDLYKHTRQRLRDARERVLLEELVQIYTDDLHAPLHRRKSWAQSFGRGIEICGEPGMTCAGCVSLRDIQALGLTPPTEIDTSRQRKACACLTMKTELLTHRERCNHQCLYCYWR